MSNLRLAGASESARRDVHSHGKIQKFNQSEDIVVADMAIWNDLAIEAINPKMAIWEI
jgi:hypothetical protein